MADLPNIASDLIDALDSPALLVDGSRTLAANDAARRLFGRNIEGHDVRLALRHPEALRALAAGGAADLDLVGIGGSDRAWRLSARPLRGGLTLVRLTDLSEVRAAERMRVDFVANASHELRTPLATIAGYAETLAEDGDLDEGIRKRFGSTIQGEARRMQRIVQDLMSLSRIEADRFRYPAEQVELAEVARIAAEHASALADSRRCSVDLAIEDGLPPIAGDFAQLCQAVDNLVANALRYGCNDQQRSVRIELTRDDNRALLAIRDWGDGIAAEHLPRLTERFYRVDAARSRDGGGTGLGLAIVKHIVERHQGTLDIKSRPGHGTTVELRLPLACEA